MAIDMEYERMWSLLTELSKQLTLNRQHCEALQQQAEDLKVCLVTDVIQEASDRLRRKEQLQAIHNSTGFTLRRFNTDISQEQFESELERLNATLVLENHALQHENKQLSMLMKDYEGTLESVMSRFRTFAHSTQEHDLHLTKHYESLLQQSDPLKAQNLYQMEGQTGEIPLLHDPVAVQESLFRLSDLLRKALRAAQGEAVDSEFSTPDLDTHASGFGATPLNTLNAKLGGYLALLGQKAHQSKGNNTIDDDALEREVEMERLRVENELLRQMLGSAPEDTLSSPDLRHQPQR